MIEKMGESGESVNRSMMHGGSLPSQWLQAWLGRLGPRASVLDFAAGTGRNARAAAALGHRVVAADRDARALAEARPDVHCVLTDLEAQPWPFEPESFDAIIVSNYLFRPRLDLMCGLLRPTGVLLYQTFAQGNAVYGRPSNPNFLLAAGELLDLARRNSLHVLAYEDGVVDTPKRARIQRMAAVRAPFDPERWLLGA